MFPLETVSPFHALFLVALNLRLATALLVPVQPRAGTAHLKSSRCVFRPSICSRDHGGTPQTYSRSKPTTHIVRTRWDWEGFNPVTPELWWVQYPNILGLVLICPPFPHVTLRARACIPLALVFIMTG